MPFLVRAMLLAMSCIAAAAVEPEKTALAPPESAQDTAVATCLAEMDVWVLTPPKYLAPIPDARFDLKACHGVRLAHADSPQGHVAAEKLAERLSAASGVSIGVKASGDAAASIRLAVLPTGEPSATLPGITAEDLADVGPEGYALHIDEAGVSLAARDWPGLFHGMTTLSQMATDRSTLPGLHIRDWPSLRYRGIQQDISRGQVPTMDTFRRLVDVLAESHLNILEPYIEHTFKYEKHPDISPPEGISPEEGRALFDYAAERHVEVHPLFQALGHSYHILNKPQYHHLRIGPCEKTPWIMTYDIRKPEAVAFVNELVDELCAAFPGRLFNVDITEIDCDGMLESGMTLEDVTDLVYGYVLQLNEMVKRHDMRLMIAQGPLDSTGHLAGMGAKLDTLPRDIIIGSYYCAGGPYSPAWEKDFPRLQERGFDFFAQAWIGSHIRLTPPVKHALDFSDAEVSRGLAHGAVGSITTDWGDAGNYHLTGQTWYPFAYHGACAWTGANLDRDYFNQAFTWLFYGISDDSVSRAIHLAGNISSGTFKTRGEDGNVTDNGSYHFWEFFGDPFTRKELTVLADPALDGQRILKPAAEAVALLERARAKATRNQDNLDQLLFGARNYEALGHKLIALAHYNDSDYPREDVAAELEALAATYESLKEEFRRLWLAEDRENDNFHSLCSRFDQTIVPCRQKAAELRKAAA
jgi:Glycosyl hydrolase family 20, domain 2/Glycosyl hydrolase family 20, catalytic domain